MALEPKKQEIVQHGDGPLLVIAGPGAGKTKTIVERVVHLIGVRHVPPESIFVSTFTEKAARELLTRVSRRLAEEKIDVSPNEMYLGTLHSLFLRILKEHAEFTRLKKNYKTFDDFDQKYAVYRRMFKFRQLEDIDLVLNAPSNWRGAETLCSLFNLLREECISPDALRGSSEPEIRALARAADLYATILADENALDFSAIQSEMLALVEAHPEVLAELRGKIRHFVIDEYQDTNTIQERILLKLAGDAANICVVGDEDQSIYRFRGASVRNILQFAQNFAPGRCKTVVLDTNFRSHPDVVRLYNDWMTRCDWRHCGRRFRYDKKIAPQPGKTFDDFPGVVRLAGEDVDDWCARVYAFITTLREKKVVTDLNQIAFLFHSVKGKAVAQLVDYLEARQIPVFSPRSGRFFEQLVVRRMIGLLFFIFPQARAIPDAMDERQHETADYYVGCMEAFADALRGEPGRHADLLAWARRRAARHKTLARATDYTFLTLFYEALKFPMFADCLAVDHDGSPRTSRDAFNLALFSQLLAKFEFVYSINVLSPKWLDKHLTRLFTQFFHFLRRGGLEEFEDYEEPLPSGCVSVMTIHQSKGLEFPVTVVGSLDRTPRRSRPPLVETLERGYFARPPFEPLECTHVFDFWREYYVAFSRAQNLLVLTGPQKGQHLLGAKFDDLAASLPDWEDVAADCDRLHPATVRPPSVKNVYAFTSDILLYENCPLQYMAYRYLGFAPHRQAATMFGSLVHQTIEDVHKAHLRGEAFDEARIASWFDANYASLSRAMKTYLSPTQRDNALEHVRRYVDRNRAAFANVVASEYDVSVPAETFVLHGVIDLLRGEDDAVEIVDFKTDKKPDVNSAADMARVATYRRQLEVYAHIVERKLARRVTKMHLYYTRVADESPYVSWDFDPARVGRTMDAFTRTVAQIEGHRFSNEKVKKCARLCDSCDMRFYCHFK